MAVPLGNWLVAAGGKEVRSQFVDQDQQTREDMKKEKRRIQDQLRRLKRQEEKGTKKKTKPQKQKPLTTINVCWDTYFLAFQCGRENFQREK